MNHSIEIICLIFSLLAIFSILASKFAFWLKIPYLLLLLIIGMLAGSEGIGGIEFDDYQLVQNIGIIALIFILFSGAIDTNLAQVQSIFIEGVLLSTIGIITSTIIFAGFCHVILKFTLYESLLLGSIVSSTDAAVVFSILRTYKGHIPEKLKTLIEFESGSNDPMSILLTMSFISIITTPYFSALHMMWHFIQEAILSIVLGIVIGKLAPLFINSLKLEQTGLYPVLTMAIVLFTYSIAHVCDASGFLTVYVTGLYMGKSQFCYKQQIIAFHENFTWLMQIITFLALGLLVFPYQLLDNIDGVLIMSFLLMLVARPMSVIMSLIPSAFSLKEQFVVSCAGIRGAVPMILATFPLAYGLNKAHMIFNTVFCIVLTSIFVQGSLLLRAHKFLASSSSHRTHSSKKQ